MSKNPAPRIQFNFMENEIEEDIPLEETIEDDDDDESIPALCIPEPVKREEIKQETIFDIEEKNQILKDLIVKELPKPKKEKPVKEPKLTKSGKPRKPLSDAQKEHLALGRQRAIEVRRQKKIQREEDKVRADEEAELLKKKKQIDFEKLKKEVEEPVAEKPAPAVPQGIFLTPKQLEEAQLSAIMSYEKIRADRKAKKKEEQLIEQQKQEIRNKLTKPVGYSQYNPSNRFYNCY